MKKLKLFLPIIGLAILLSGCSKWIDRGESILENSSMYKGAEAELVCLKYSQEQSTSETLICLRKKNRGSMPQH